MPTEPTVPPASPTTPVLPSASGNPTAATNARWKPLPPTPPAAYGVATCPPRKPVPVRTTAVPIPTSTTSKVSLIDTSKARMYWCHVLQEWRLVPPLDRDAK
ncbi:hypothetical protein Q9L58_008520 [Maublancomyces gigas]|uniref:Uncharacterized protein n=1 Tax=Discina gigas TaxID=1032678 RepID=A0ABR3G9G6_9PEZI